MPDDPRFTSAFLMAQDALSIANNNEIPPTPSVFEVLLTHLSGLEPELEVAVAKALHLETNQREERINQIYDEYLGPAAIHMGLTKISQNLTSEIADMSLQVTDGLQGNLQLAQELRQSMRDLAEQVSKDDLRNICKHLTGSNRGHLQSTQGMAEQLEKTQFQLTEMQKELTLLRKSASTDHLTGLPNRRYLDEKLSSLVEHRNPFCFAMLDLDHFKKVNDTWGHSVGDNILRRLGELLRQNIKGKDVACRVGGEEFGLILPDTSLVGAEKLCQSICSHFSGITWITQNTDEEIGTLTLSGGVSSVMQNDTPEDLYERTDKLLYAAKSAGRNRIIAG